MPNPDMDRVKFNRATKRYFEESPLEDFAVYDGSLGSEPAENYSFYAALGGIDVLVIKAGTSIVAHEGFQRTAYNMSCIAEDISKLKKERGLYVILVSSGAIGLGRKERLRKGEKISHKDSASPQQRQLDAIEGQPFLSRLWHGVFKYSNGVQTSDYLVTHADILEENRHKLLGRYARSFMSGEIPIVNEDDAKSLEEIDILMNGVRVFGDNDELASLHAQMFAAAGYKTALILLSNTDGIYTADSIRDETFIPIRVVRDSTGLEAQVAEISSSRGRGGIVSKIQAAKDAVACDVPVIIANGQYCNHDAPYQRKRAGAERRYNVLEAILDGNVVGTRFVVP
ncbi:MAG TPA: hypothetical protein VJB90_05095 [Candidatus Nanoarchaeia archaeon]|nr:hypothetical protein [Candidatus Nanoarchaeia archaeon]